MALITAMRCSEVSLKGSPGPSSTALASEFGGCAWRLMVVSNYLSLAL